MLQSSHKILKPTQRVQYKKTILLSNFEWKQFPKYLSSNLQSQGAQQDQHDSLVLAPIVSHPMIGPPYCLPVIHVTTLQFRISIKYNKKEMKFANSNTSSLSTGTESWTRFPINSNFEFNCCKTSRTSASFTVADFLFSSVFFIISVASSPAFFYKQILKFSSIPDEPKN